LPLAFRACVAFCTEHPFEELGIASLFGCGSLGNTRPVCSQTLQFESMAQLGNLIMQKVRKRPVIYILNAA